MSQYPKVYILTAVHNNISYSKQLLNCVQRQRYKNIKVIIIDDGSSDGTYKYISSTYPEFTVLKGDGNLWWTGSLFKGVENILSEASNRDFILILNADCTFDPSYINSLVTAGMRYPHSIIGSLVVDVMDKKTIIDGGVKIDWFSGKFIGINQNKNRKIINVDTISDGIETMSTKGTLYPVEIFRKIGNFDKAHLPHYISDYEFACRAKRSGYKLIKSYKAIVYNDVQNTGFADEIKGKLKISELLRILFSRKSKRNIRDLFWFITLCCPPKNKLKNYHNLGYGILNLLAITWPIYFLTQPIIAFRKKRYV